MTTEKAIELLAPVVRGFAEYDESLGPAIGFWDTEETHRSKSERMKLRYTWLIPDRHKRFDSRFWLISPQADHVWRHVEDREELINTLTLLRKL